VETTARLVELIRAGDMSARDQLIARYLTALQRWARGRLPAAARSSMDTQDLVQVTLLRSLDRLKTFEARETGSFLAYMRQVLKNLVRDEVRKWQRRPRAEVLDENLKDDGLSPIDLAVGSESMRRYEQALEKMPTRQREGLIMRLELRATHQEVADALGMESSDAARMMVKRALIDLAERMDV
jgi:RNA polymerase sigma-70 factor (ECF subfamily)